MPLYISFDKSYVLYQYVIVQYLTFTHITAHSNILIFSPQFYTVVKNVKKTHQLQESGEFQEFNDDVEYFLDALRPSMPVSTRCLAALNLAQKCMVPAFRMHLRAHGTVIKFFSALSDAHSDHVSNSVCWSVD